MYAFMVLRHGNFAYYRSIPVLYFQSHCRYRWQFLDDLSRNTSCFHVAVWGGPCIQSQHQQLEYEIIVSPFHAVLLRIVG